MGTRLRDAGVPIGGLPVGGRNAITDVAGVSVGHTTLISGDGPLVVGNGPVRTGVTVIVPGDVPPWEEPLFAGAHVLNGNGEVSGLSWLRESGTLTSPIGLTNTHSLGAVRDALAGIAAASQPAGRLDFFLPVVGETYDGWLNDIDGQHVKAEHVRAAHASALASPSGTPIAEGSVGGGTGMICHGFKGGIGTSSRIVAVGSEHITVGVLVQANHGQRARFTVNGVCVGRLIDLPQRTVAAADALPEGAGSIIVVVATDAPLLPHQLRRVAARSFLGVGRVGGLGEHSSGDLAIAFSTARHGLRPSREGADQPPWGQARFLNDGHLDGVYAATVEATEEAIVNAVTAAPTMVGRDGASVPGLSVEVLAGALRSRA